MFRMRNIVGNRVRAGRGLHKPKLTQSDLAAKLQVDGWNISRSGVGKIELGLRQVTDIELLKLAKGLDRSIEWLLEIKGKK